jgi:hypothetical protein
MRFGALEFRNAGDRIAVTGRSELGFALGTPMKLSLQVVADDEAGALDARINYARGEEGWLIAAPPPLAEETPALRAPELVVELGAPIEPEFARGVRMELPRDHFGLSHRTVRLRFSASIGDSAVQHYPRNGYVTLDLTPALFTIALSQASRERRVKRGGTLRLEGQGWQSTTFTGQAGLMLWLRRHAVSRFIALEALPTPIPKRWAVEANLPDDLEPGKYRLYLLASCQRCGVDTSASGTLTIV